MKKIIISLILVCAVLISSCDQETTKLEKEKAMLTVDAFETKAEFTPYENQDKAAQFFKFKIQELDAKWDPKNKDGEIAKLNNTRDCSHLSDETIQLLLDCIVLSEETDGKLDITLYPLTRLWKFESDEPKKPDSMLTSLMISKCGMDTITVNSGNFELGNFTMLDASAVTKGYAADLIAAGLVANDCNSAVFSIGDHIRTVGKNPDQEKWTVYLFDPFEGKDPYATLSLDGDLSVSTKGTYQKYFEEDGKRYCNIFDPKTGEAVDGDLIAATVICKEGIVADAYATACFIMGGEEAKNFYRDNDGFELILVYKNGDVFVSEGISDSYKLSDNDQEFEVIKK